VCGWQSKVKLVVASACRRQNKLTTRGPALHTRVDQEYSTVGKGLAGGLIEPAAC
jgi:hypothetical protein